MRKDEIMLAGKHFVSDVDNSGYQAEIDIDKKGRVKKWTVVDDGGEFGDSGSKRFENEASANIFRDELISRGYWTMLQRIASEDFKKILYCVVSWALESKKLNRMVDGHFNLNGEHITVYQDNIINKSKEVL